MAQTLGFENHENQRRKEIWFQNDEGVLTWGFGNLGLGAEVRGWLEIGREITREDWSGEEQGGRGGDKEGKHKLLCARDGFLTPERGREKADRRVYPSRNFVYSEGREDGKQGL